jgi:hypothetical protein
MRHEFPGSQPVSLSSENWGLLSKQRYDLHAALLITPLKPAGPLLGVACAQGSTSLGEV